MFTLLTDSALKMNEGHEVAVSCRVLTTSDPSLCQLMVLVEISLDLLSSSGTDVYIVNRLSTEDE